MIPERRHLIKSFQELLELGTGRPSAYGRAPDVHSGMYTTLHAMPGGELSGPPLTAPEADGWQVFQVDSVAGRDDQAIWLADRVRKSVLDRFDDGAFKLALEIPGGWRVNDRMLSGGFGQPESEGRAPNLTYTVSERFSVHLTPEGSS